MTAPGEPVLEDLRWLRALAARLVRDPGRADDAVQDALLMSLERPPRDATARRGWLAAVLRNVLWQERRAAARRDARERSAGRMDTARPADDAAAELELHRRLVERVHALDEPYRTVIVLRYLRGLPVDAVARELGVPEKTVRTRLDRALAKLRERLGPERERWLAVLALPRPLPVATGAGAALLPWILPMNLKRVTAAAAALLVGAAFLLHRSSAAERAALEEQPEALAFAPATPDAPADTPIVAPSVREPAAAPVGSASAAAPPPAPVVLVHGFVRDLSGAPLAGVAVVFEHGSRGVYALDADVPAPTSAADGAFEIPLPKSTGRLTLRSAAHVCIAAPQLLGAPPLAPAIVVGAPARTYAGTVVEPSGAPVAGAYVEIGFDGPFVQSRDVGGSTVHLLLPFAETHTDEAGRFHFEREGFVAGARVAASKDGFESASVPLPADSTGALELVLEPSDAERILHGLVVDAAGAPAGGAQVALGGLAVETGADGRFALTVEHWRETGFLRAVRPGALPAELALADALRPSSPDRPIVLQLGGPPLAIRGRVVDADGAPVPGAIVWTSDVTPFGSVVHVEGELAFSAETTLEAMQTGHSGPWGSGTEATADASGDFALGGLLERAYMLFALDPRTFDAAGPVELRAGVEGARLVLAREPSSVIAGRVVSRAGVPLAGVRVTPGRGFPWTADQGPNAAAWAGWHLRSPASARSVAGAAVETDADGRFALPELVVDGSFLSLRGGGVLLGEYLELANERDPADLEIVADAAARFRVVLPRNSEADAFCLEQAEGQKVVLFIEVEGATITAHDVALEGGRSGIVLVEEGTYVLALLAGGEVVRRVEVALPAGGLSELTP